MKNKIKLRNCLSSHCFCHVEVRFQICIKYESYNLSLVDDSLSSSLRNYQTAMVTIIRNYNTKLCSLYYSFRSKFTPKT